MSQLFDDVIALRKQRKRKYQEAEKYRREREQKNPSGELTAAEQREHGQMLDEVERMTKEIEEKEQRLSAEESKLKSEAKRRAGEASDAELRSLEDLNQEPRGSDFKLTNLMRGVLLNDWSNADYEQKYLEERAVGIGGSGSYILGSEVFDEVFYSLANRTAVMRAGARTMRLDESGNETYKIPRLDTRPTAEWHTENSEITPSDAVFSSVNVTPQTLAAFTKISRELIQDSPLAEQALRQAFSESLGLEVDRAAMFGSGSTPEPTGITNVSGVPSTSVSATLTVDHVMNQYHRLLANNVPRDNIAVIMPARAWEVLQNDTFSDGRYKLSPGNAPGDWDRITKIVSNQVPVSSGSPDTTQLVAGDFRNLVVAVRRMLEIDLSREGGALQSYQAWSLAAMRADIAVVLPNAFDVSTDVQLS